MPVAITLRARNRGKLCQTSPAVEPPNKNCWFKGSGVRFRSMLQQGAFTVCPDAPTQQVFRLMIRLPPRRPRRYMTSHGRQNAALVRVCGVTKAGPLGVRSSATVRNDVC